MQDGTSPDAQLSAIAARIETQDRARFDEIAALLVRPVHLLLGSEESRLHNRKLFEARADLLGILRRAEASGGRDERISALIRHYEGRDERP